MAPAEGKASCCFARSHRESHFTAIRTQNHHFTSLVYERLLSEPKPTADKEDSCF